MKLNELKQRVQKLYEDDFSKTECAIIADTWAILNRELEATQEKLKEAEESLDSAERDLF